MAEKGRALGGVPHGVGAHRPAPYPACDRGLAREPVHLNELFVPVLNEAGIDLMLCGHDHRYSFHPAGERDAKFPIVVNDNRSCVRCDVADSLIRVRIAGPRDKTVHTHEFPLKPQFQP